MKKRITKPAAAHPLVQSTRDVYAHESTAVVMRARELRELERQQIEEALLALAKAAAQKRKELADVQARIAGMTVVIERR